VPNSIGNHHDVCTQGGANSGLRAYGVAQVVEAPQATKGAAAGDAKAVLKRFWRPEEVSRDAAYKASFREVGYRPLLPWSGRGHPQRLCRQVYHLPHTFCSSKGFTGHVCSTRTLGSRKPQAST